MKTNIDARGRAFRRNSGAVFCMLGAAILASAFWTESFWPCLWTGAALILSGLFQLFESRMGWCAIRAVGIRTPL